MHMHKHSNKHVLYIMYTCMHLASRTRMSLTFSNFHCENKYPIAVPAIVIVTIHTHTNLIYAHRHRHTHIIPVAIACAPSSAATAENAQQLCTKNAVMNLCSFFQKQKEAESLLGKMRTCTRRLQNILAQNVSTFML